MILIMIWMLYSSMAFSPFHMHGSPVHDVLDIEYLSTPSSRGDGAPNCSSAPLSSFVTVPDFCPVPVLHVTSFVSAPLALTVFHGTQFNRSHVANASVESADAQYDFPCLSADMVADQVTPGLGDYGSRDPDPLGWHQSLMMEALHAFESVKALGQNLSFNASAEEVALIGFATVAAKRMYGALEDLEVNDCFYEREGSMYWYDKPGTYHGPKESNPSRCEPPLGCRVGFHGQRTCFGSSSSFGRFENGFVEAGRGANGSGPEKKHALRNSLRIARAELAAEYATADVGAEGADYGSCKIKMGTHEWEVSITNELVHSVMAHLGVSMDDVYFMIGMKRYTGMQLTAELGDSIGKTWLAGKMVQVVMRQIGGTAKPKKKPTGTATFSAEPEVKAFCRNVKLLSKLNFSDAVEAKLLVMMEMDTHLN